MDAMDDITSTREEDIGGTVTSSCCKGVGSRGTLTMLDVEETEGVRLVFIASELLGFGAIAPSCSVEASSPWTVILVLIDPDGSISTNTSTPDADPWTASAISGLCACSRARLSASHISHFHCSRCVRPYTRRSDTGQ